MSDSDQEFAKSPSSQPHFSDASPQPSSAYKQPHANNHSSTTDALQACRVPLYSTSSANSIQLKSHIIWLSIAIAVILLSLILRVKNGTAVELPVLNIAAPQVCNVRRLTGYDCPGCGLTRSFVSIAHGRFSEAWSYNPAGFFWFLAVAFQVPYRMVEIIRIRNGNPARNLPFGGASLIALTLLLLVVWIARMLG